MKIERLHEIIIEEIIRFVKEQDDDPEKNKIEKEKQDIQQQKVDLDQKKFDFQQQQADDADREADKRDAEKEKTEKEKEGEEEKQPEPNISFKTQGEFYTQVIAGLKNVQLSDGNLLDDGEKNFVALAAQAAEGRFDKGFEKFLRKGKAGNVYGKDFSDKDIQIIMSYVKENDLVR